MKLSKALQQLADRAKGRDSYWVERAKLNFAVALEKQRRSAGLNYAALAEKLGTSAAYISKVFRGDANLTIESMVKLSRATGAQLSIIVADERVDVQKWAWVGRMPTATPANNQAWRTETSVGTAEVGRVMYG